jgi:hypothetical protein
MADEERDFYQSLPVLTDFASAVRAENYRPLPDDWSVGLSDIVGSTKAIVEGRYKAVNMIGAGVVAAVSNALGRRPFPFVFGGDGASFAVSGPDAKAAAQAVAAMAAFSHSEFAIDLRVAMIPVAEIRAAGRDVRVARYGASPHASYAMFTGGGVAWFEERVKVGEYALPVDPKARPDLSGLSCRWTISPAKRGVVLSVIVAPRGDDPRFVALLDEVVAMALAAEDGGRPVTVESLSFSDPSPAIQLETSVNRAAGAGLARAIWLAVKSYATAAFFHRFMLSAGSFDMKTYVGDVAANADFRKFDDGLRMTLDCTVAFADALEAKLASAAEYADYGTFRQTGAQVTCFAPTYTDRGHLHFIDGAGGGYAMAASAMKARRLLKAEAA